MWTAWLVSASLCASRPTPLRQLAVMASGLAMVVLIVIAVLWVFVARRLAWWRRLIVPVASVVMVIAGVRIGWALRDWTFRWNFARYEAAAQWVDTQPITPEAPLLQLPAAYADLAYAVHARKSAACGTVMHFFSILRDGDCRGVWRRARRLAEHWYEAVD